MSKLDDLEKELYGADGKGLDSRLGAKKSLFGLSSGRTPTSWAPKSPLPAKERILVLGRSVFKIFLWVLAIAFFAAGATFVFFYFSDKGQEAEIKIQGSGRVESGEVLTLPVVFKNLSRSVLKEAELAIVLPEGTRISDNGLEKKAPPRVIKKLEDVAGGEERAEDIAVRVFGREGEDKIVEAVLTYRPSNMQARFSVKTSKVLTISRVPLAIAWEAPEIVSSGQEVEIKVRYFSESGQSFDNLAVELNYPQGFSYFSADPKPDSGETFWKLGLLGAVAEGFITLRGKISGESGEAKGFQAKLGVWNERTKELTVYSEASHVVEIATSPLTISGTVGGEREFVVSPAETIFFILRYKNNSERILRNVYIRAFLESGFYKNLESLSGDFLPNSGRNMMDFGTFSVDNGGVFDSATQSVVWSPGNLEELRVLEPGGEGQISFSARTRDSFPMRSGQDKNLVLRLRSVVETSEVPAEFEGLSLLKYEDRLDLKSKSKVLFSVKALYRSFLIANSGPLPPRVGAKTTYTVFWELRNFSNDLQNAEVKATLPPNIKWENVVAPSSARITFNQSSGEARWAIGSVAAGAGVLSPALTGAFQVSVVPAEADAGRIIKILNESGFLATDTFTKEKIEAEAESLTTQLDEDPTTSVNDWKVAE